MDFQTHMCIVPGVGAVRVYRISLIDWSHAIDQSLLTATWTGGRHDVRLDLLAFSADHLFYVETGKLSDEMRAEVAKLVARTECSLPFH